MTQPSLCGKAGTFSPWRSLCDGFKLKRETVTTLIKPQCDFWGCPVQDPDQDLDPMILVEPFQLRIFRDSRCDWPRKTPGLALTCAAG